jgi:serine protease Do
MPATAKKVIFFPLQPKRMKRDPLFYDLLDQYHKGLLGPQELSELESKMANDTAFRQDAQAYLELIGSVQFYGRRRELQKQLDQIHHEILHEDRAPAKFFKAPINTGSYWRWSAIAASIAIVISAATFFLTQSLQKEKTADYQELLRDVEQIQESQKQIIADLAQSKNAPVRPGKFAGTSFLLSSKGYIATSYHVIKEADSILIENKLYGRMKARLVHSDPKNDLAILRIESRNFKSKKSLAFVIAAREADLGEYVYTLGFPREDIVFGEGSVSASSGFRQNPNAYQISVPVNPGNSGGPLLNSNGEVIGIVSGVQTQTAGAAFAIKSKILLDLVNDEPLDSLAQPVILPKQNGMKGLSRIQQIKKLKEVVFMVRVYKEK